jgi:NAD(P)H-hydrate epimerase
VCEKSIIKDKKCQILLTPHVKEFSRLHNVSTEDVITNSISLAKEFANKYGVVVALKSSTTVITDGDRVCINITGNASLAKAGSGDVLAGLISGIATKQDLFDSACVGAYVFGIAGEIASAEHSEYSVVASLIPQYIGRAIKSL